MTILYFIEGIILSTILVLVGYTIGVTACRRLLIGDLKIVEDEDDLYLFMEGEKPLPEIIKHKFIMLRVKHATESSPIMEDINKQQEGATNG